MSSTSSGVVTFVFTDLEESTASWERLTDATNRALARHDLILRRAIEAHGGTVVKTTGDGFFAVFARAGDGLAACVDGQVALHAEDWGEAPPPRIRMALHAGEAFRRDDDYFGPAVNRTARLLAAGHGGQILMSGVVRSLAADQIPPGAAVRDHGEHRLRDLMRPEQIFELIVPGLPSEFPPLRTLDRQPTNLPTPATVFFGRQMDVAAVRHLLLDPEVRLLTLTGPGGVGKTRLAVQGAQDLLGTFRDGVFFVPLDSLTDPTLVPATIAQQLGLTTSLTRSPLERLREDLRDKEILLILDNFEHLLPAASSVAELIAAARGVKVLVTSRAVLKVYGERDYPVEPLTPPDPGQRPLLSEIARNDAVKLFVDRARATRPDFALTAANAALIAQICQRLDGLPLALELAAARTRVLSPAVLLARLEGRLKVLTGGAIDQPPRQQTLRAAIEWSYDLLNDQERTLFRRLAVFAGGCTLEAAETVSTASLDGLDSLIGKSLLRQEVWAAEPRFSMLDTIREFALEQLAASGEDEVLRRQHAARFLELAEEAAHHLESEAQADWLDRLETEHANLRASLAWSLQAEPALGVRLAIELWHFWDIRGHHAEGQRWLRALLAAAPASPLDRARALFALGSLLWATDLDPSTARPVLEDGLAVFRKVGTIGDVSRTLARLGRIALIQGDHPRARSCLEESLGLSRKANDRHGVNLALRLLGELAAREGNYHQARSHCEESLALDRMIGEPRAIANSLNYLGMVCRLQGDEDRAGELFAESLAIGRKIGAKAIVSWTIPLLGGMLVNRGDFGHARRLAVEALTLAREMGAWHVAYALQLRGRVAVGEGEYERGVWLLAAAEAALLPAIASSQTPEWAADSAASLAAARATLPEAVYQLAWRQGQLASPTEAISSALADDADESAKTSNGDVA